MTVNSLNDLKKLIQLCRKTGVQSIKVDNIEFHLGQAPRKAISAPDLIQDPLASVSVPTPQIYSEASEDAKIITDELTEEQLMFYSARPEAFEEAKQ